MWQRNRALQAARLRSLVGYHFTSHPMHNYRDVQQASAAWKNSFSLACLNHGLVPSPASRLHVFTVMSATDIDKALGLFQAALVDVKPLIAGGPIRTCCYRQQTNSCSPNLG